MIAIQNMLNKLIKKIKSLFSLPGPKELGKSDHNSLPSRKFSPFEKGYCWEDHHKLIAERYPIRNWIFNVLFRWFRQVAYNTRMRWYDFKSIWINKDHLIDLRQRIKCDHYDGGYIDPVQQVLYANFNILCNFVESKQFERMKKQFLEQSIEDESDKDWQDALKEAVCLHHYWMVERTQDDEKYQMLHNITNSKKTEEEYIKAINICADFSKAVDNKEDDMLARLIKIRRFLWC